MLYGVYGALSTLIFVLLYPLLLGMSLAGRMSRRGLGQRTARYRPPIFPTGEGKTKIWLHAASVGEIQAVKALLDELSTRLSDAEYIVSTMTEQGRMAARRQLPEDVYCCLAPLDVPFLVKRALDTARPDLYVCFETELWPAMLTETARRGVKMALLNARMSERSFRRYGKVPKFMARLLSGFSGVAAIHPDDRKRFSGLGVNPDIIRVTGNIKYDLRETGAEKNLDGLRKILGLDNETIFICGSTRTGEEEILAGVYRTLRREHTAGLLWILAPRHMERIGEVCEILSRNELSYDRYSDLLAGSARRGEVVLIDCMGVLATIYGLGRYNFCGGSLVNKGGHNIMEIIRWGKPVYFGPHMADFRDAVALVIPSGAGFQCRNGEELAATILEHMRDDARYEQACGAARRVASSSRRAAEKQADIVTELLAS